MTQVGPLLEYFQYDNKPSFSKKILRNIPMTRASKSASSKTVLHGHLYTLISRLQILYCISEIKELEKVQLLTIFEHHLRWPILLTVNQYLLYSG
jgi:hypothetical protein